jgi:hypothetical protein
MWSLAVAVVLVSVAAIYSTMGAQTLSVDQSNVAMEVAAGMGLYRQAVINYFTQNDVRGTGVSLATLKSSQMLPTWSILYQQANAPIWDNYRDANGTIYVYATSLPSTNIIGEITTLSNNSILVGTYRNSAATLQSAIFGDTNIPVTALAGKSIPDGAPLWIAMTQ